MKKQKVIFIFVFLFFLVATLSFTVSGDTAVKIEPQNPVDSSTLHCYVISGGTGYSYYWYKNGQYMSAISGAYVSPSYTFVGDLWKCVVKKYYGSQIGWVTIGEDSVKILPGQPPTVNITEPTNGAVFNYSNPVTFSGVAFDPETGALTGNSLVWRSNIDGQIGLGNSFSIATLSVGTHIITLTATDPEGLTAAASVTITILPINQPPSVTIVVPDDGSVFNVTDNINFRGVAFDPEDGELTGNSLVWRSNIDGQIGLGNSFSIATLSVGTHIITLTATDSLGFSSDDNITITILPPSNNNPSLIITSPNNGEIFNCNAPINFEADVLDVDGDNVSVQWTSNIDSYFSSQNPVIVSNLTCNATHIITAIANDGRGGINQSQITINILPAPAHINPSVTILTPLNNSRYIRDCEQIYFSAEATAYEGANITSYSWVYGSSEIGNTQNFSVPANIFALGNNTIMLRVDDDMNGYNNSLVTIEVVAHTAPHVQILNPLEGAYFWDWETIFFNAVATATDSCPTNFTWIWADNYDSVTNATISNSQSFNTTLPPGDHRIVVYAIDNYNTTAYDIVNITINQTPNLLPAVSITSPINGTRYIETCEMITFTADANDPDGTITSYSWYWGSTLINSSQTFSKPASFFGQGNHTVLVVVRDNSSEEAQASANFVVISHSNPNVTITSPADNSSWTETQTIPFSAQAVANDVCPANFSYTWSNGTSIISDSQNFNLSNLLPGSYTFSVIARDNYGAQAIDSVAINVEEIPNIPPDVSQIVCVDALTGSSVLMEYNPINCSATATDQDGNITNWVWAVQNFYGPVTTPNLFRIPAILGNGTYNITLSVFDNEGNETSTSTLINVANNQPQVTLTSNVTNGEEPLAVLFTCSVDDGTGNRPYNYELDFGNGVTSAYSGNETSMNFRITYNQNGTYTAVCNVTDRDGDLGTDSLTIEVTDTTPQGFFNFSPQNPIECTNVYFTTNITAYDGILSYFWNFADGTNSTLQNPVHNFTQNGLYNVILSVFDRDGSEVPFSQQISVQDTIPLVEAGPDRNVTEGNNLTFVGSAIRVCDEITDYEWDFGDSTEIQHGQIVSHNFTTNGTFIVTFTAIDADGSRASDNLTVIVFDTSPIANGTITPNPAVEGTQVTLNASLSRGYDTPLTYEWNINGESVYGAILNYTLPSFLTNNPVVVPVVLTVRDSDGSINSTTINLVVLDSEPTANATLVTPQPIYEGQVVVFDSSFSTGIEIPLTYTWYFGDNTNETTQNITITHIYEQNGSYFVRLVVSDADNSTDESFLFLNVLDRKPSADFNWTPYSPLEGQEVTFNDISLSYDNITQWRWDFGDGGESTQQNPTHTFRYNGTYNVTLYVKDFDNAEWQNTTKQVQVQNLNPSIEFTIEPETGNELLTVQFNCSASGNSPFTFDIIFSDGTNLSVVSNNSIVTTKQYLDGTYTILCRVTDNDGDITNQSVSVYVNDLNPNASLSGDTTLYQGQTGIYNASQSTSYPDPIIRYEWDWDYNGIFSIDETTFTPIVNHTFYTPGNVRVAMRVVDSDSVSSEAPLDVTVLNLPPVANFTKSYYEANESQDITFEVSYYDPGFDAVTFEWDWDYNGTFNPDNVSILNHTTKRWDDDTSIPFLIAVRGVDNYGGIGNVSTAVVKILNVAPVPTLNIPVYVCNNDSATNQSSIILIASVFDPGADEWTYLWDIRNQTDVIAQYFDVSYDRQSNITFNCAGRPLGLYNVTLNVRDDDGGSGNASAIISITNDTINNPPVVILPNEGEIIPAIVGKINTIPVYAFDPDSDDMTIFDNESQTSINVFNSTGILLANITITPLVEGLIHVNLTVCDDSGMANNCSSRLFIINATQPNRPPVATLLVYPGREGEAVILDGSNSYDPDGDVIQLYIWSFGANTSLGFETITTTPTVSPAYYDNGTFLVNLTVVDTKGENSSDIAYVYIADVPPALAYGPLLVLSDEDVPSSVTYKINDVPADPITEWVFTGATNVNISQVVIDNFTLNVTFTPKPNWFGNEDIYLRVTNKDGYSLYKITVRFNEVNDEPVIEPIPTQSVMEDSNFSYQVVASDNDTANPMPQTLTYSLINAPFGMTINSSGFIRWTPTNLDVGMHNITVMVEDGFTSTNTSFLLIVNNTPTEILNCPLQHHTITAGQIYTFDLNSSDENFGDVFELTISPTGMTINNNTGLISWTPTNSNIGLNNVKVRVNDGKGGADSCSYYINVTPQGSYNVSISASPTNHTLQINNTAAYTLTITNTGTIADNYRLILENLDGADYVNLTQNYTSTLNPSQSQNINLYINASQQGLYDVRVTVFSNTNPSINASVIITTNFTTGVPPDITPPTITPIPPNVVTTNNSATISWTTNEPANTTVRGNFAGVITDQNYTTNHNYIIYGLNTNTTYTYNITTCDINGNCYTYGNYQFTTGTPTGQTIINSTINNVYYNLNFTYEVPNVGSNTTIINSVVNFTNTINNSRIENASPVIITGGNSNNCTILNKGITSSRGCVNVFVDPSDITLNDPTGSTFLHSYVYYYNVTYSLVNLSYINYSVINNSKIQNSTIVSCTVLSSEIFGGSFLINCKVVISDVTNSSVNNSTVTNSTIINSNITNSSIINSTVTNSNITNSSVNNSTVTNSTIINSNITNSSIINSTVTNSTIIGSNVTNSTIINATIINQTIINSTINGTQVCGGVVNGYNINGLCVYMPVITQYSVPSSAERGKSVTFSASIINNNSSNNETAGPYTYVWYFGDGSQTNLTTNNMSNSVQHTYTTAGTYKVTLFVYNKYNLSVSRSSNIQIRNPAAPPSGGGGGGGGGGSGGSVSGGSGGGVFVPNSKLNKIDLESKTPQTVYVDYYEGISFDYNGVTYSIVFNDVSEKHVDLTIHPPKIPVTLLVGGSTLVNLDEEPTDDLSLILNKVDRVVIPDAATGIGRVRWKINMTLNLVKLEKKKQEVTPVEKKKEERPQEEESVAEKIKSGVLDVIATMTPKEKPSPVVGSSITAGIIAVGIIGYLIFRKRGEPKFNI